MAEGKSEVESTRRTPRTVTGSEDDRGGGWGAGVGREKGAERGSQPAASKETETSGAQLHRGLDSANHTSERRSRFFPRASW